MYHFELLYIQVTVSPGAFNTMLVAAEPPPVVAFKLVGVIVTAFVPDVDELIIVLICPSVEAAAKVQGAAADVALTNVVL